MGDTYLGWPRGLMIDCSILLQNDNQSSLTRVKEVKNTVIFLVCDEGLQHVAHVHNRIRVLTSLVLDVVLQGVIFSLRRAYNKSSLSTLYRL